MQRYTPERAGQRILAGAVDGRVKARIFDAWERHDRRHLYAQGVALERGFTQRR